MNRRWLSLRAASRTPCSPRDLGFFRLGVRLDDADNLEAVQAALRGPVTPACPASILRTQPHVTLYLDQESAALLD